MKLHLFQAIADRLTALLLTDLALDFEAQLLSRQADRRAELLVQAEQHDRHGFPGVAEGLRRRAEALDVERPLAVVLPAPEHGRAEDAAAEPTAMLPDRPPTDGTGGTGQVARLPAARRKGTRP